ncbi:cysteine protease ATG4 [Parastagonospora nodorum]|uniref:Probable cysteine protease ATG4 n=2 Tax=Phaeosphaeria nodorum (strain SN15 / ATCC MYA-4574 / FGSC 10173) TaxID=321614 RepID=ATG4_PHANO|nr:RecName: Full=Probable cysteine protease ATG4; AltName: Full=Autophagy-related protein 4 [Parastagonospora nodorum SN15]KAH3906506.1 cysteine protease ATG4 [Parastagonospora nodorum]KAH3923969.1 cysteine protease ATG4 [Parastagonospora nodorum]KAH3941507.1 cysteine protease ATG4 [Parastagonospora nodorum]KAH3959560.1 cysteine protease ATG4 [Parastagonospora nodorum]KAH4013824.1 cysteine protease ATG4 [Parastagonospora nodorum]
MNDFERFGRNVVRTFYDPPPCNESNEPIWLLGQRYDSRPPLPKPAPSDSSTTATATAQAERNEDESWIRTSIDDKERKEAPNGEDPTQYGNWPSAFLDDFESRVWMTYRSGFSPIQKSQDPKATSAMSFRVRMQNLASPGFTSDAGFGCMIRSGQCILANALQILRLGRDWRWQENHADKDHAEILSLFADDPQAPFSIHRFVEHGAAVCGKYPGEWFGPSAAARCIQDLANKHREAGLKVYVSGDGADVYEDKLKQVAVDEDGLWQPTLILVGTRLGIDKITPVYWEALKASLQIPQSIGIAGGRPSASHYFVGVQGNNFYYLDPHSTRPLLPFHPPSLAAATSDTPNLTASTTSVSSTTSSTTIVPPADSIPAPSDPRQSLYPPSDLSTCHTRRIRRLQIREMDPSMLLAFLVTSEADYQDWKEGVQGVQGKSVVHVQDKEPPPRGQEREGAIDEVESWDEDGLQ